MDRPWLIRALGFSSDDLKEPIHSCFFVLDSRGEQVEREVYEFFEMLGDVGGFNDGLQMVLGYMMLIYNSRWYFIKLNLSVFRTARLSQHDTTQKATSHRSIDLSLLQRLMA